MPVAQEQSEAMLELWGWGVGLVVHPVGSPAHKASPQLVALLAAELGPNPVAELRWETLTLAAHEGR